MLIAEAHVKHFHKQESIGQPGKLKLTGFNLPDIRGFPVVTKMIELHSPRPQLPNHQLNFYRSERHIKNKEDLIYADDSPLFSCGYMQFHEYVVIM